MESQPQPPTPPFADSRGSATLGIAAAVVAAILCPLVWYGIYDAMGNLWIPMVLSGIAIGVAARLVGRSGDKSVAIVAAGLSVLANTVGYVIVALALIQWTQPPTLGDALGALVNDIGLVVLMAIGGYLAFIIARTRA